jgi:PAS domain S-box-containing protein
MTERGGDRDGPGRNDAEAVRLAQDARARAERSQRVAEERQGEAERARTSADGRERGASVARAASEGAHRLLSVAYNASEVRATTSAAERDSLLALFAALPVGVVLADVRADDQPIVFANAAFTALTGYPAAEALGRNCRFLQGVDTDPEDVAVLRHAIANDVGCTVTLCNYRRNGTPFWNELTLTPLRDAEGQVVAYVGVQADATARVEVERRRAEAEAAVRMRDQLLSLAAHDLRSPLTALLMQVQMQTRQLDREHVPTVEEWRVWLTRQRELLNRELAVVQEVTDAAYLQLGQHIELQVEPVDLPELARQAAGVVAATRGDASVEIATGTDAGDMGGPIIVAGDPSRLGRVLQNVIGNAVKYSPEGAPVAVTVTPTDDGARVVVRDQGVGIPADELPRIFSPFYRASTARGVAGTGLGLAGAKAIVEQHGGTIALDSAPGVGTTVTIILPRDGAGVA